MNLSIRAKVLITLGGVFVAVVASSAAYTFVSERDLVQDVVLQKAHDTAYAYFDGVNTMMLTGTMPQRETLRNKLLANPDVVEVRIVRGEPVNGVFGPGLEHERPADELDRRALQGEEAVRETTASGERLVTLVQPVRASANYRGTNCLTCHTVPEGTVLGAIRVGYSLASLDRRIGNNILASVLINAVSFGLGIGFLAWLLHRLVLVRLNRMRDTMQAIEEESDLGHRFQVQQPDEIGRVGEAFNSMLSRFAAGLNRVAETTHQLGQAAERIAAVSERTARGVMEQRGETDSMATAINQMESTAQEVRNNAAGTAEASRSADGAARDGAQLTGEAIAGIGQLADEIQRAEEVIARLDRRSRDVGSVLDVIKGIAEQTNLLALNAAIEAARAGEMGRGFAVVADEVRTLATRSHESTQEIEQIIALLQQEAGEAVQVMGSARDSAEERNRQIAAAAQSLEEIATQVSSISELNTQMAQAAAEQSAVTGDVNRNVVAIVQVADRTAEEAAQTAQVSEELVDLVHRLEQMLGEFRL